MTNWAWVTPLVSFVVGLIGGAILLWNNRQRPHDVLKTYVEIYNDLPEGEIKDRLWAEIAERLRILTTPRESGRRHEVPIQSELGPPLIGIRLWGIVAVLIAIAVIVIGVTSGLNAAEITVLLAGSVVALTLMVGVAEGLYAYIKR
ncbi:hypothetical protein VST63_11260 [Mycolicibacterium sp. 050232]|uniref:hypothetical protein n=1 Tax=Mycolicibacterium sp. 050232 TaxID=3113982 RepID=UPI002E2D2380|nr:hypothetical protein [Mycolicibacterium sp. 050232]MED5812939.1 hypothetical protein [Mycolicibacterium sp. 050232]